jgi:hypothetical protein
MESDSFWVARDQLPSKRSQQLIASETIPLWRHRLQGQQNRGADGMPPKSLDSNQSSRHSTLIPGECRV